jgi:hypothetical protein
MFLSLATTLILLLKLWVAAALLTLLIHAGVSLAIDRRFTPGTWEKLALALLMMLGPLGVCLEIVLVVTVWQDIRRQPRRRDPLELLPF